MTYLLFWTKGGTTVVPNYELPTNLQLHQPEHAIKLRGARGLTLHPGRGLTLHQPKRGVENL